MSEDEQLLPLLVCTVFGALSWISISAVARLDRMDGIHLRVPTTLTPVSNHATGKATTMSRQNWG